MNIIIGNRVWQKLMALGELADDVEISGLGRTEIVDPENIKLVEVFFLNQVGDSTTTELDKPEIARLLAEQRSKGVNTKDINCWWHFHTNFGVFWSGTDDQTINNFATDGHIVSLVFNKDGESLGRVDTLNPIRLNQEATVIVEKIDTGIYAEAKEEFGTKFTEKRSDFKPWRKSRYDFTPRCEKCGKKWKNCLCEEELEEDPFEDPAEEPEQIELPEVNEEEECGKTTES